MEEAVNLGSSDIYPVDDLCYNLEKVRKFCNKHGVQVRMIVNEIPSQRQDKFFDAKAPYFIPEIVDELEKYVDVIEFNTDS